MAMKPTPGMTGGYCTPACSLRVEVISYSEFEQTETIKLRVLKNLSPGENCEYEVGEEFIYQRRMGEGNGGVHGGVESLILD